jgi:ribosomal protein L40E
LPNAIADAITALQAGLAQVPAVVIVIGLLVGPTLAWIGYRTYVMPRAARPTSEGDALFWICRDCRSANQVRARRCYHCGLDRLVVTEPLRVVDRGAVIELAEEVPSTPSVEVDPGPALLPSPAIVPTLAAIPEPDPIPEPVIVVPEPIVVAAPAVEPTAVPEPVDVPVLPLVAVGPGFSDEDLPPTLPPLVADDLPELYWTCAECRLPNEAADDRCRACGRERATGGSTLRVVGGIGVVDLEADAASDAPGEAPLTRKATRSRRPAGTGATTRRRSSRRDAAS